jgi:predicted ATPase/DNA-binding winged helix-turn-helix (wHTH) protein
MLAVPSEERLAFASFHLYPTRRSLVLDGEAVSIGSRAFDMLTELASHAGAVVSLRELKAAVWPNLHVDESNLRVQINLLRKILARCDGAQRAIETVPLKGYCFVLPVLREAGPSIRLGRERSSPAPLPSLGEPIGRADTIRGLSTALHQRRLVTVTGPGGIGKSTVAVATAAACAKAASDGMHFVDLSAVAPGTSLFLAIAAALGIPGAADPRATLTAMLNEGHQLLILDTCEHLVEDAAAFAETILADCDNLRILVTSREALRATGEWTHRLPSLAYPEEERPLDLAATQHFAAMELFVDRVCATMRYELNDRDLPLIAQICRQMDGIPLALEFAAARVADLGIREIARQSGNRFAILNRGRRAAIPRHQTLAAAFDWSYDLLLEQEKSMLTALASCGDRFTRQSIVLLAEQSGCRQPLDALAGLFEKSMLRIEMQEDGPHYRLLDTTRAYVLERVRGQVRL